MQTLNNNYKALAWVLIAVITLTFFWQGALLLLASPDSPIYKQMATYGLLKWSIFIGFWELLVAVFFINPKTSRVGYLLAMMHWGGMFFLQLSQGHQVALTLYLMILSTGVNYVRNPTMFNWGKGQAERDMKNFNEIDDSKTIINQTKRVPRRLPATNDGAGTHSYKSEHRTDAPQFNNTEVHYANQ